MKREEKQVIIDNLTEQIKAHKHIYISDISELDAAATQELRRACFKAGIKLIQVKNTLLRVALDGLEADYNEIYSALTGSSAVMLSETGNAPAKLIKEFRKNHDKPVLKAAFVEECAYVGENQLDALVFQGELPNHRHPEQFCSGIFGLLHRPAPLFDRRMSGARIDLRSSVEGQTEVVLYGSRTRGFRHGD